MEPEMSTAKPDAFRNLVEGKITTEQYLRTLDERVEELRQPKLPEQDETPQHA